MITTRLYYDDSYTTDFTAQVIERLEANGQPALLLDRTYFYPASGGQPADMGEINGVAVTDVYARDDDAAVVHVLAGGVIGDSVVGRVDWARRFDHMQHHTGQHILTQAFVQVAGAQTVGFHLSPDSVTIDLDATGLSAEVVLEAERLANQVIWDNLPVMARLVSQDDAADVRMRKLPGHLLTDGLRVIDIGGYDVTACGGTHVARTGEIGLIKVLKLERRGDKTRVEFRCGRRALGDYQQKNAAVNALVARLTCSPEALDQAVGRVQDDLRAALRDLKAANHQLIEYEANSLLAAAVESNGIRIVKSGYEGRDPGTLKLLAARLAESPGVVALLGTSGEKSHLVLARSADLPHDMNALIRQALALLDGGRGGGQPALAQGGGGKADLAQIQAALDAAAQAVTAPQ